MVLVGEFCLIFVCELGGLLDLELLFFLIFVDIFVKLGFLICVIFELGGLLDLELLGFFFVDIGFKLCLLIVLIFCLCLFLFLFFLWVENKNNKKLKSIGKGKLYS